MPANKSSYNSLERYEKSKMILPHTKETFVLISSSIRGCGGYNDFPNYNKNLEKQNPTGYGQSV
jgi:hypothetical protein